MSKHEPPRLTVEGEPEPISLCALGVDVRVAGTLAELVWNMTFRNPHGRTLECELQFPLPDEASVSGYGVEIGGTVVDAVPVPKETARVAFEEAVREGRDAGLAEAAKGNVFTTRVAAVPPNGTKRVRVAYEVQLTAPALQLPLCSSAPLETLDLHALVLASAGPSLPPRVDDAGGLAGLAFDGAELSAHFENVLLENPVVFGIPALEPAFAPPAADAVPEVLSASGEGAGGEAFFLVNDPVAVPAAATDDAAAAAASSAAEPSQSKRVALFYDASLSRAKHDKAAEATLLRRVLDCLAGQGVDTVDVVVFRNDADDPKTVVLASGGAGIDEIIGIIEGALFDGGTMLQSLEVLGKLHAEHAYRSCLLWTDGLATLGREVPADAAFAVPIHVFCSDAKSNPGLLAFLAQKSGGVFHNVSAPNFNAEAMLEALVRPCQFGFLGAECGEGVAEIFPAHPVPIVTSGRFAIAGRLTDPAKGGSVVLSYGFGTKVTKKVTIAIPAPTKQSGMLARVWARKKVAELEVFGDKHKDEITKLGVTYNFVTPGTSLLVLESLDQYRRYGITPSERGLPQVYAEYARQKKEAEQQEESRIKRKLDDYAKRWHERVRWWEKKPKSHTDLLVEQIRKQRSEAREARLEQERRRLEEERSQQEEKHRTEIAALESQLESLRPPPPAAASSKQDAAALERDVEMDDEECEECEKMKEEAPRMKSKKKMAAPARRSRAREAEAMECCSSMAMAPPAPCCAMAAAPPPPPGAPSMEAEECCRMADMAGGAPEQQQQQQQQASAAAGTTASVKLKEWDPDTPYLAKIKAAKETSIEAAYEMYIQERESNFSTPAFYLDVAEFFWRSCKNTKLALRVLTCIVELGIEEPQLYRIVGYKLDEFGEINLAICVFEKVLSLRENEPQSHRDLANVVAKTGDYARALQGLWRVVTGQWDSRFDEIELTSLTELNRVLWIANQKGVKIDLPKGLDKRFIAPVDVDLRISMAWDTDMTDVDLHTIEPSGEEVYYGHKNSENGGLNSRDFTRGYGPEEYMCHYAMPGVYKIRARYYASHTQSLSGGTTILLHIFTHYSRPEEQVQLITIRLASSCDIVDVGEIDFKREPTAAERKKLDDASKAEDQADAKADAEIQKMKAKLAEDIARADQAHERRKHEIQVEIEKAGGEKAPDKPAPAPAPAPDKPAPAPAPGKPAPAKEEGGKKGSRSCKVQ